MQMIEGEQQVVLDLFETIREDSQHSGLIKVMSGAVLRRSFEDWTMWFSNMEDSGELPPFEDYLQENLGLNTFQRDAEHAGKLMVSF